MGLMQEQFLYSDPKTILEQVFIWYKIWIEFAPVIYFNASTDDIFLRKRVMFISKLHSR